jgi:hypothetical protein
VVTEAGSDATSAQYDGAVEIPCLWFFLPLPHPLGIPTGWRSEQPLTPAEVLRASSPTSGLASSLLIHQLDPSVQPVLADMADLGLFAAAAMKNEAVDISGAALFDRFAEATDWDLSSLYTVRTIAEVAVPGFTGEDESQVLKALDLAIDHVRFVQRAVAVATQEPVELMSRATLPPTVPTFHGVIRANRADDPESMLPEARASIGYFIPDCAPPTRLGLRLETFDDNMLSRIIQAADRVSRRAAFEIYADLRREALVQRQFGGNNRMALVALAAAGEVLLALRHDSGSALP